MDTAVLPDVSLDPRWAVTAAPLTREQQDAVREQALQQLAAVDPILRHIVDIKVSGFGL